MKPKLLKLLKLTPFVAAALAATITASHACEMHNADAANQTVVKHKSVVTETRDETVFKQTNKQADAQKKHDGLSAVKPWAKPNYGPNGAAYFTLKNNGKETRYLTGATAHLSEKVELHQHIHADGIMKMRPVSAPLAIKPGDTLIFAPSGYHVMLFGMSEKKKQGEKFTVTLEFKNGEKLPLDIEVADKAPAEQ